MQNTHNGTMHNVMQNEWSAMLMQLHHHHHQQQQQSRKQNEKRCMKNSIYTYEKIQNEIL